ncbi:MAG TPA: preprotein translocase subunit YajC [Streptosporangiaceae bacterium]|nr:preprotein translocase subunit YajC [Streptosporangiaceae bacterium]
MGTLILAAGSPLAEAAKTKGSNPLFTFLILAVLIGLFYVLIMRPQRNRQRKVMETQREVVPGQRIRTTAGMYGTVVSGDDRDVVIEIAPGVEVTMLRRAIMEVIADDQPMPETIDEPESDDDTPADDWDIKDDASADDVETKDRNV